MFVNDYGPGRSISCGLSAALIEPGFISTERGDIYIIQ
jgi:hypothetical protein